MRLESNCNLHNERFSQGISIPGLQFASAQLRADARESLNPKRDIASYSWAGRHPRNGDSRGDDVPRRAKPHLCRLTRANRPGPGRHGVDWGRSVLRPVGLPDYRDSARRQGQHDFLSQLYARRVLRIVPVYIVFVTIVTLVAPALEWTTPQDGATLRGAQGWYWTYLVNAIIARRGWSATPWHTSHLWSLSVEEQFCMLWPAVVFAAGRQTLLRIALSAAVASAVLRAVLVFIQGPSIGMYVLLPVRMDSLAVGAGLAVLAREPDAWATVRNWAPVGAPIALSALVTVYRRELLAPTATWTEIAAYPALALLGGSAVVAAVDAPSGSLVERIFAHPVLRFFGRYSYGLYVWHQLAIACLAARVLPPAGLPVVAGSHLPGNALFVLVAFAVSVVWALRWSIRSSR
ncbi:MAG TPA: acyltransferase [Vicinamibacterales bacterium]|nr:acyltransferase [Vicinamibacterales bacterium]